MMEAGAYSYLQGQYDGGGYDDFEDLPKETVLAGPALIKVGGGDSRPHQAGDFGGDFVKDLEDFLSGSVPVVGGSWEEDPGLADERPAETSATGGAGGLEGLITRAGSKATGGGDCACGCGDAKTGGCECGCCGPQRAEGLPATTGGLEDLIRPAESSMPGTGEVASVEVPRPATTTGGTLEALLVSIGGDE